MQKKKKDYMLIKKNFKKSKYHGYYYTQNSLKTGKVLDKKKEDG